MSSKPLSPRDLESLSAYLDGQLPAGEQRRLESRLAQEPALRASLEEMRRTRLLLRSLPRARAPRNFTLKPNMIPARPRPVFSFAALSWSALSALAALILAVIFISDFIGAFSPSTQPVAMTSGQAPESVALATSLAQVDAQAARSAQATTQVFGTPGAESAGGMGGGGSGNDTSPTTLADLNPTRTPEPSLKSFAQTQPLSGTTTLTSTLALAPLNPTLTISSTADAYGLPTLEVLSTQPAPGAVVFTPLWIHLVEGALLLVVVGAGLWAVLLLRRRL